MAERRRKTRANDNDGKGAAGKSPRRGKARPGRDPKERPDPPQEGPVAGQNSGEPVPAPDSAPESPRVTLPGEFYLQADCWWWRVKLPGEDKVKARPLKLDAANPAAGDRQSAEKTALEMWENAVREDAVRQIRLESTEKIERLKAQFLDKVRHFTELVETANAQIDTETKARAEAEAKLAQMTQSPEPRAPTSEPKTEDKELPAPGTEAQARELENATPPASNPRVEVGACECCAAPGVAPASLTRIESGQLLCPRCLAALRADIIRIESTSAE